MDQMVQILTLYMLAPGERGGGILTKILSLYVAVGCPECTLEYKFIERYLSTRIPIPLMEDRYEKNMLKYDYKPLNNIQGC